jgi:hypothetical protein
MSTLKVDSVDVRIERWRKNLVDTSLRNRLLDIKESRLGCLRLSSPGPQEIYRQIVERKLSFEVELGPEGEASIAPRGEKVLSNVEKGKGDRSLMIMRTKAREAMREQGVNILFLTIGVLEWSSEATQGEKVRSPLLLVPVELVRSGPLDPYVLKQFGEEVTVNPTLAHKLRSELSLTLPALPEENFNLAAYLESVQGLFSRLGWEIYDAAYLGLFKFPKMCMYDELGQFQDLAATHPVIRALAGEPAAAGDPAPPASGEASAIHPDFQVLDADSSQQEAVALALSGTSFVLQGPPGTGKSQTIANIISETLSAGRTVLFVSEKMAALAVVKKRLDARGLGDYCLELHNHDHGRQEVVEELSRCLAAPAPTEALPSDQEELGRARASLDGYVDALHQVRDGLGMSFHELLSELTRLRSAPEVPLTFPNLERMSKRDLEPLEPLVKEVEGYATLLAGSEKHPWSDCLVDSWKLSAQSEIVHRLSTLKLTKVRLVEMLGPLCQDYGLAVPADPKGASDLIDHLRTVNLTPYPRQEWLESDPSKLLRLVEDMRDSYLEFGARMSWLRQMYHEDVLALDLRSMQRRFQNEYQHVAKRLLSMQYRSDMGKLRSLARQGRKVNFDEAVADLVEVIATSELADRLHGLEEECSSLLGQHFRGENTDWDKLRNSIKWTKLYYEKYGRPASPALVKLLCGGPDELIGLKTRVDGVEEAALRFEAAVASIGSLFDLRLLAQGRSVHEISFDELTAWAQAHLDSVALFQEWTEIARVRREAAERGMADLLTLSAQGQLPATEVWSGVRKRYFTLWHDLLLSRDRRLRDFDREGQERAIAHFAALDRQHIEQAPSRARALLDVKRRALCDVSSPEQGSGLWVLRHEVSRKRKLRPLRELFSQAMGPIQTLKPCLLMSPLSVSTYLDPAKARFDLVIFDEASQVRPEDAIGPIMRGHQVIVVGDSKQLPPTDFFRDLNEEEEDVPDLESILDECSSAMPQRMLLWHYRSRQESLIAFSNQQFYGGRLLTFPSAMMDRPGLGVEFVHVPDGQYDRARTRKNLREAERVADLVVEHVLSRSGKSIGVVAFSEPQQMAILEELEKRVAKMPSLAPLLNEDAEEGFFVKNLENVQGDERDVMLFSIGYGKDAKGRVFQNFGPLNRPGGERRLNVAITRAREHVKLITSMLPEDLEGSTPGVDALRSYMQYARSAEHDTDGAEIGPRTSNPTEEEVRSWLESKGLVVEAKVGRSLARVDLAIVDPDRPGNYLLGILTDGDSYRRAGSTRDRERLKVEVLSGLGWRLLRLWSQDWIKDKDAEVGRIMVAVAKAREEEAERAVREAAIRPPEVLVATRTVAEAGEAKDDCTPYVRADLRDETLVSLYRSEPQKALAEAVGRVVDAEGPVHIATVRDRVKDLIAAATGKRPGNVDKLLAQAIGSLDGRIVRVEGDYLWAAGSDMVPVRRSEEQRRDIDQVCPLELEVLVRHCVPKDRGANMKEVVSKVAGLLGYKRPTLVLRSRIEAVVTKLGEKGGLSLDGAAQAKTEGASPTQPDGAGGRREEACP